MVFWEISLNNTRQKCKFEIIIIKYFTEWYKTDLISTPVPNWSNCLTKNEPCPRHVGVDGITQHHKWVFSRPTTATVRVQSIIWHCHHVFVFQSFITTNFRKSCYSKTNQSSTLCLELQVDSLGMIQIRIWSLWSWYIKMNPWPAMNSFSGWIHWFLRHAMIQGILDHWSQFELSQWNAHYIFNAALEKRCNNIKTNTTVDSLLMDTSLKWTSRVTLCLSLLPLFDFL